MKSRLVKLFTLFLCLCALLTFAACGEDAPAQADDDITPPADEPSINDTPTVDEPTANEPTTDEPNADEPTADEPTEPIEQEPFQEYDKTLPIILESSDIPTAQVEPVFYADDRTWNPENYSNILALSEKYIMFSKKDPSRYSSYESGLVQYYAPLDSLRRSDTGKVNFCRDIGAGDNGLILGKNFVYKITDNNIFYWHAYGANSNSIRREGIKSIIPMTSTSIAMITITNKLGIKSDLYTDIAFRGENCKDFIYDSDTGIGYILTCDGDVLSVTNCNITIDTPITQEYETEKLFSGAKEIIAPNYVINTNGELVRIKDSAGNTDPPVLFDNVHQCVVSQIDDEIIFTVIDIDGKLWRFSISDETSTEKVLLSQNCKYIFKPSDGNPTIHFIDNDHTLWTLCYDGTLLKTDEQVVYFADGIGCYAYLKADGSLWYRCLRSESNAIYVEKPLLLTQEVCLPSSMLYPVTEEQFESFEGYYQAMAGDRNIYFTDTDDTMTLTEWLERFSANNSTKLEFSSFFVLDFDKDDGHYNVVIAIGDRTTYGQLVLKYRDGKVCASYFTYNEMTDIKENGDYSFSGLTVKHGIKESDGTLIAAHLKAKLLLKGKDASIIDGGHEEIKESEFNQYITDFYDKEDVKWYEFNHDNIEKLINWRNFSKTTPTDKQPEKNIKPVSDEWSSPEAQKMLDKYLNVIWGDTTLIDTAEGKERYFIEPDDAIANIVIDPGYYPFDLNLDGIPELFMYYDIYTTMVLYEIDGTIYRDSISYRNSTGGIFDGNVFHGSGGASDSYYATFDLSVDGLVMNFIARSTNVKDDTSEYGIRQAYYLYDVEVTKEEYDAFITEKGWESIF